MSLTGKKQAASAFRGLREVMAPPPMENTAQRGPGRPAKAGSKRSNPDYRPWSGLLRGQYVDDAMIRLRQTKAENRRDMSDLITDLLGEWLEKQQS
jgi:hypothetical protein